MSNDRFSFYKEYPKTCSPDDFWGQVKRTVNGTPVTQEQIDMIVDAVVLALDIKPQDTLLDLCCGNGALSTLLFERCSGGLGVDFSEFLINIAEQNFSQPPKQNFILQDVVAFCENPVTPNKFTKIVCYGSFPYLDFQQAEKVLILLNANFPNLERVFIGNCPDKSLLDHFSNGRDFPLGAENDPSSQIGIWRTANEFVALAKRCGWQAKISKMQSEYYAAHYRYDVTLLR